MQTTLYKLSVYRSLVYTNILVITREIQVQAMPNFTFSTIFIFSTLYSSPSPSSAVVRHDHHSFEWSAVAEGQ